MSTTRSSQTAKLLLEGQELNERTVAAVEETLRGRVIPGLPNLLARLDLIVETDTELVISDWKTSRSRWNAEQADEAAKQLL